MAERIVFHIDVNSAFLSWTAAHRMCVLGDGFDLRTVPSAVAGDKKSRHSIILAKSGPAKKFGIQTGEPLGKAMEKCPNLVVVEPDYELYVTASRSLIAMLREYSPLVEQFSIDEAWIDMTGTTGLYGPPVLAADRLRERIHRELGFTVNIGISCNKLLAKMAGDFEKPDKTHTLFPAEIPAKLWPLPVRELFMVGRATDKRLKLMGIRTIGELANTDPAFLRSRLGKQGEIVWQFANGRDAGLVRQEAEANKGYGNSFTTPRDVTEMDYGRQVLLSLCETVGMRLRRDGQAGACMTVHLRSSRCFHRCGTEKRPCASSACRSRSCRTDASGSTVFLTRAITTGWKSWIPRWTPSGKNSEKRRSSARRSSPARRRAWRAAFPRSEEPA